MDSSNNEVIHDFPGFFKAYRDGRKERYESPPPTFPAGLDPNTGVQSIDVVVSPETGVKARVFLPAIDVPNRKLPLLVHYHGGGFSAGSPFDEACTKFLTCMVCQANIIAISIDYRLAPEHLLPIAYDDSWAAQQWIAKHSNGLGPELLLNNHVDFERVFLAGESAGANIAHYVAVQTGVHGLAGLKVKGVLITHPYFGGVEEFDKIYQIMCPTSSCPDNDPKMNPAADPNLPKMGCDKVLVCLAEYDSLKSRGEAYYKTLANSEWDGQVEIYESKGEDHFFHMFKDNSEKDVLIKKFVNFIVCE